jgi:hypothetical protein
VFFPDACASSAYVADMADRYVAAIFFLKMEAVGIFLRNFSNCGQGYAGSQSRQSKLALV